MLSLLRVSSKIVTILTFGSILLLSGAANPSQETKALETGKIIHERPLWAGQTEPLCEHLPDRFSWGDKILQVPQDFSTIQGAIDAAPEGTTIRVNPGTYRENLVVRQSVRLQGLDAKQVILKSPHPEKRLPLLLMVDNRLGIQVLVEGFTLEGGLGLEVAGSGVQGVFRRNVFRENGIGIYLATAPVSPMFGPLQGAVTICENTFETAFTAIHVIPEHLYPVIILGNRIQDVQQGIRIENAGAARRARGGISLPITSVLRNHITRAKVTGVQILNSLGTILMDNLIEFSMQGVVIGDSDQIDLVANRISNNQDDGLQVMDSQRVLVKDNNLDRNGGNGTRVHESNMIQFIGNEFFHNAEFGILTQKIESIILCKDNKLAGNGRGDYGLGSFVIQEPSKDLQILCEGK